jgi:alpha-L-rhamnosidase
MIQAIRLKCEYLNNPLGIDYQKPVLFWNAEGAKKQTAYEIRTGLNGKADWQSGLVKSSSMRCRYNGNVTSRDIVTWQVLLYDENGKAGKWSDEQHFELGLLSSSDWTAKWICGAGTDKKERLPADYYNKTFQTTGKVVKARLYTTACGIYEASINGERVEGFVLAPGCTQYDKRLYYQTYDVTGMIAQQNEITFIVGDGWYKGKIGSDNTEYFFGRQTKLFAQLEITYDDGRRETIATDSSFRWCNDGPFGQNDLKDGVFYDAGKLPSYSGNAVETRYPVQPAASNAPAIKEHEHFIPRLLVSPSGKTILDFGQNMAGYVRFAVRGEKGNHVTLRLGETLDNGEYTDSNFSGVYAHGKAVKQQIDVILSGKEDRFIPNFFYSGFRYALVEGPPKVNPNDFEAIAVYSDIEYTGKFECSNEMINKFAQNTVWSQKSNFVDIPTDCPQREKSGWTGDAQVFAKTATYFADTSTFFRKWLKDVRDCQREDGRVDNVCPKIREVTMRDALNGSTGWADAAVIIPYMLWKMYGDIEFIRENYPLMHGWEEYVIHASADKSAYDMTSENPMKKFYQGNFLADSPFNKYVIETGVHWGEWAEPEGVTGCDITTETARPKQEENAAYMHYSMKLLAEMLHQIGKDEEAALCEEYSEGAKKAYNYHFVKDNDINTIRQAKLVRPLALGLLDKDTEIRVAKRLNDVAIARNYKIGTGFLSTPFILPVLADYGYLDTAYKMLENQEEPGWLAMVAQGATTVWEHYNGYDENGHPLQTSFNHYSPGAVCSFLFSHIAGIRVAGENEFIISPHPGGSLTYASASFCSAYGTVTSGWKSDRGQTTFTVNIPANCTATVILPDGREEKADMGEHSFLIEEGHNTQEE